MTKFKLPEGPQAEWKAVDALPPGAATAKPRWQEEASLGQTLVMTVRVKDSGIDLRRNLSLTSITSNTASFNNTSCRIPPNYPTSQLIIRLG